MSTAGSWAADASDKIVSRAEERLARQIDLVRRRTDRLFAYLLGCEWLANRSRWAAT